MNHRERFITTIQGGLPDRVPVVANLTVQVAEKLAKEFNLPVDMQDSFLATRISHREILKKLGNDAVLVAACRAKGKATITLENGNARDEWGLEYRDVGLYSEAVVRPLSKCESIEDLEAYDFPDAHAEGRFDHAKLVITENKHEYGIIGDLEACIFELAWNLVGMEKFMMDLATEEDYVFVLLDKLLDFSLECGKIMIDLGADLIWTGDDMGTQTGMMISPQMWREHFKPRMKRLFDGLRAHNPNIKIAYHSCGAIRPIIPNLIEIGLDVLNPLQPLAKDMDLSSIYQEFSDQLIFFGGIDVQDILPNGTTKDVEQEVLRCIKATDGGKKYIIAPAHNIQPDTPTENVFAFFEAVKAHGAIK